MGVFRVETDAIKGRRELLEVVETEETDSVSKPTSGKSDVWPFPNYGSITSALLPQHMVTGQDFTFGAYTTSTFVKTFSDLHEKYSGEGTGIPVFKAGTWYQ